MAFCRMRRIVMMILPLQFLAPYYKNTEATQFYGGKPGISVLKGKRGFSRKSFAA
jgi:hypothetical protein